MNQQRWNFLTALLLSTAIAPISSVRAEVTAPVISRNNDFPQSLPTVAPLNVTTSPTKVITPVVQIVPQVSRLPIVVPLARNKNLTPTSQLRIVKLGTLSAKQLHTSPVVPVASTAANFSKLRVTTSLATIPNSIEPTLISPEQLNLTPKAIEKVAPQVAATKVSKSFTSQAASAPIFVSRSDNAKLAKRPVPPTITNSVTVQAEMTVTPIVEDSSTVHTATAISPTAVTSPAIARSEVITVPRIAPLVTYPDRSATPSFESGLPVFIFGEDRPPQIVATAIAQVGDEIVAPEPSIAIPVERPKQVTIPTQSPASTPAISKIDPPATTQPVLDKIVATQTGQASWYGAESGNRTANGERFNPNGLTAAHRTLPFGTMVRVTSLKTGKSVIVRINDRGPFRSRRIVDLSAGAAEVIGLKSHGVGDVRMDILDTQG